jgi:hypothetical protein
MQSACGLPVLFNWQSTGDQPGLCYNPPMRRAFEWDTDVPWLSIAVGIICLLLIYFSR